VVTALECAAESLDECARQTVRARPGLRRLLVFPLYNLLAAIVASRAHVMAQVHLAAGGFHRDSGLPEKIVRPAHAAPGRGFLVLLHCHIDTP
jgi:hypothetical protein